MSEDNNNNNNFDVLVKLPETYVSKIAEECLETGDSGFLKVLLCGQKYKEANLTPIYILNTKTREVFVGAEETYGKKLH